MQLVGSRQTTDGASNILPLYSIVIILSIGLVYFPITTTKCCISRGRL